MKKENYSPEYKRCIDLRILITETKDVLALTRKAPDILGTLARGEKFPSDSLELAIKIGLSVNKDGTPTAYTSDQLEGFIADKRETKKGLKESEAELQKLIDEKKFPRQDSSDVTNDTEPFDPFDPDL